MKSKEQAAEEFAGLTEQMKSDGFHIHDSMQNDINCFLAGWDAKAKQDEERILLLAERLKFAEEALEIILKGTHEEFPTCMPCGDGSFGPPRTNGWEGWAREIDSRHKTICKEALSKIRGEVK